MDQFADIVFGLVSCHRDKLLGFQADSPSRTTGYGTRKKRRRTGVMNFRGLLLSAFKGHGGASVDDSNLFEQQVVYVDISRENAADTLTVRRMIHLIRSLLTPGRPGCPRFVVIGGDQPSYKMIYEIWLNSRRESRSKPNSRAADSSDLPLHEWLIPFPRFFHCEKQAMFSLCKELLDGLGLHEVAECVGLSAAQVSNILKHGHARNNRALLFSFACAMLIHVIDMVRRERPDVQKKSDALMQKIRSSKNVVTESGKKVSPEIDETRPRTSKAGLYSKTTEQVDDDVIELGKLLRNSVQEDMCKGPNGRHFISTVLLGCLLPTVGFHVLSRTGHTDVTEAFWFRLTYLLHASNHLKYQELSLFYAFLRGILPTVVVSDLFKDLPGLSVMKLPSFTGSSRTLLNKFGWTYVQLDEALEMLIVRHLKSLCVTLLNHLENSAAWLMQVSNFRSLARRVTGASRAFGRFRGADDAGESGSALRFYDRNDLQSNTVSAMLKLMRERGFLGLEHRSSEWLTNVFCEPPKRIAKKSDQELILGINEHGETTTALHASVLFPEVFGCLTQEERDKHFGGKKFKKWTSCRRIPTARQAMTKGGGVVQISPYDDRPVGYAVEPHKRPKTEAGATKILSHRRGELSKAKDTLYLAQRDAEQNCDAAGRSEAASRWDRVHSNRHLISPRADAFFEPRGSVCHSQKSRMLRCTESGGRTATLTFSDTIPTVQDGKNITTELFDVNLRRYYPIQMDVMNALHYRGDTGVRGNKLVDIVTGKMKRLLRRWVTGEAASCLEQVPLHIDDPSLVVRQKSIEQRLRDQNRLKTGSNDENAIEDGSFTLPDCNEELVLPWSYLLRNRSYKDELASLHLICAAVAMEELAKENKRRVSVYLHGGSFAVPADFIGMRAENLSFRRSRSGDPTSLQGMLLVESTTSTLNDRPLSKWMIAVPRGYALILGPSTGMSLGEHRIQHGEAETSLVATFRQYVLPQIPGVFDTLSRRVGSAGPLNDASFRSDQVQHAVSTTWEHGCVILSDDTDVFFILLLAEVMRGYGVLHVLKDNVHDVDYAFESIARASTDSLSISTLYAFAGCDFLPGTFRISHDIYLKSYIAHASEVGTIDDRSTVDSYETIMCLAYLFKDVSRTTMTPKEREEHRIALSRRVEHGELSRKDMNVTMRSIFTSTNKVGSALWRTDVRNFVSDRASTVCHLVPPTPHIDLHARRAKFVVHRYWKKAVNDDLNPEIVSGCSIEHGYTNTGEVVFERQEDVEKLQRSIREVFAFCSCKGDCGSKRCSCRKSGRKCIGCKCSENSCLNGIGAPRHGESQLQPLSRNETQLTSQETMEESSEGESESDAAEIIDLYSDGGSNSDIAILDVDELFLEE